MSSLDLALKFINDYAHLGLTPFARQKTTVFYDLAHTAKAGGCIVELGSYLGFGTVPLWYGAQDGNQGDVIAVDAYKPMHGWIGEPYGPDNEEQWHINMRLAGCIPLLVIGDVHDLSLTWDKWNSPISLLVHDLGSLNRMPQDVMDWERHVIPGGVIAMRDIDDYRMGTQAGDPEPVEHGQVGFRREVPGVYHYDEEGRMIRELVRRIRQWNMLRKLLVDFRHWMLRPYASHSPSIISYGGQLSDETKQSIILARGQIEADTFAKIKQRYIEYLSSIYGVDDILKKEDGDNESN